MKGANHRASNTAAQKEERLTKCGRRDQERRAVETDEQREARLQSVPDRVKDFQPKLKNSSRVRLITMSGNQRWRRERESQDEKGGQLEFGESLKMKGNPDWTGYWLESLKPDWTGCLQVQGNIANRV